VAHAEWVEQYKGYSPGVGDGLFGKGECSCVEKDRVPTVGTRSVVELGLWGSRGTCGRKWV
jgi:hypothetical protein